MAGDTLARGAKSAQFPPANVTQEKWDKIFGKKPKPEPKREPSAWDALKPSNQNTFGLKKKS